LRPSGDRVRETLFNWLTPRLPGAVCLDLFAGSGVLGLEALSRGASKAVFVENDPAVARQLRLTAAQFNHPDVTIVEQNALTWLRDTPPARYELVFIDPPFKHELWQETLQRLQAGWLAEHASIYIETDQELSEFNLPAGLEWTKQARIGNVSLGLACEQAER
jgi:16S rRNA (guanine966-N2)-methyltransferase